MAEYVENYGKVIAIIGESVKGPTLEPVYILDQAHAERLYGRGEIVNAYQAVENNGASDIYLIRVRHNTLFQKYKNYNKAYESLQGLSVDVILPLGFQMNDSILEYPSVFQKEETIKIDKDQNIFEVSNKIDSIEYIEINERMITNYTIVDDDKIEIDYLPPGESTVLIRYYTLPNIPIEYKVITYTGNQRQLTEFLDFNFDTNKDTLQSTEFKARDVFDFPEEEWDYMATTDNEYIKVHTDIDGNGSINFIFDKEKYVKDHTKEKYFIDDLAVNCSYLDTVSFVRYDKSDYEKSISIIKEILNKDYNYGKYISVVPNQINYNTFISNGTHSLAGLCGKYNTNESLTNKSIKGNIEDNINSEKLSSYGYTSIVDTIRNGTGPYKAQTLDDGQYKNLKTIRIVNEVSKRIKKITDKYTGKDISFALNDLPEEIDELLDDIEDEKKITGGQYKLERIDDKKIKIYLKLSIVGEVGSVSSNVIADIF